MACFVVSTMALEKVLDVESITELADILTNPFHDDNAIPVKKLFRYIWRLLANARIISDQIRGDYTKESATKHQTPQTESKQQTQTCARTESS